MGAYLVSARVGCLVDNVGQQMNEVLSSLILETTGCGPVQQVGRLWDLAETKTRTNRPDGKSLMSDEDIRLESRVSYAIRHLAKATDANELHADFKSFL